MDLEYKDINEQIEIIKSSNIIIKNEKEAKEVLLRENYYNLITGYKDIFIDIKNSKKNGIETCTTDTYFEEIYAVYKFDRELRNIMFNYISIIETNIKSYIANTFSKKYGVYNYLNEENFSVNYKTKQLYIEFMKNLDDNLNRNIDNYKDIKQCKELYNTIPLWMFTTLITFGNIIKFYSLMKIEDKKEVSNLCQINYKDLLTFLKMLNTVRNIAAHSNMLFNLNLSISYPIHKKSFFHDDLEITKNGEHYESGENDILSIIIILKRLLKKSDYNNFLTKFNLAVNDVKEELDEDSFNNFMHVMGVPEHLK